MVKTVKIFLSILFIVIIFSCEQHYFYLNKIKANSETKITVQHPKTLDLTNNFKVSDSTTFQNENIFASSETSNFEILNSSIDTPKPYIIKKLPVVEEENLNNEKHEKFVEPPNPNEQNATTKIIIGVLLILIGIVGFLTSITFVSNGGNCDSAFRGLIIGFLAIILLVIGIAFFIIGLIQS